jgi:hypothetical protein
MDDTLFHNFDIIHSAGGINNQVLLSESIGYSMYARKHVEGFSWLLYLYERLDPAICAIIALKIIT